MRVHVVKKARVDQGKCSCGKEIKKGDTYRWVKGRFGPRKIRCENCQFKDSDLTGSDKLARCYDARDEARSAVELWDGEDEQDIQSVLDDLKGEIEEVASEYQESADNIREHFSESEKADECEEKAEELQGWIDEIDGVDISEFDEDEDPEPEEPDYENVTPEENESKEEAIKRLEDKFQEEHETWESERTERHDAWADEIRENAIGAIDACPV